MAAAPYLGRQTIFPQMAICMHRLWRRICVITRIFDNDTCEQTGCVCFNASSGRPTRWGRKRSFSFFLPPAASLGRCGRVLLATSRYNIMYPNQIRVTVMNRVGV